MKTRRISFKLIYLIYVLLLAALVAAAVLYVRSLLKEYEASQPDLLACAATAELADHAADDGFWNKYGLPEVSTGPFEQGRDIKAEYLALFAGEGLTTTQTGSTEDELYYTVKRDGRPLAEIKLKASGPAVTKLAVLSIREWSVASVTPLFGAQDYTLTIPNAFAVQVNGVALAAEDGTDAGNGMRTYTLAALYLEPSLKITDKEANCGSYTIKNGQILVEYYDYDLTLPSALTVSCNGTIHQGENVGGGRTLHSITLLSKPSVAISDVFGNTVYYEGGEQQIPLTCASIIAGSTCSVNVNGAEVPTEVTSISPNPDLLHLADYVTDLPTICTYNIAILQNDAEITVTDTQGNPIELSGEKIEYDLTGHVDCLETVPDEVATQVDVLQIAQNWSMFMTDDLPFSQIKDSLIAGSYQYNVALKYATGVDIKYTSKHTLADPAFTENKVTNFTWITDDCFSVDISFVKHMRLYYGAMVDDPMNDRFYFVRYDDTDNGVDDPAWKLASMKEVV